jgi:hypothetical protein
VEESTSARDRSPGVRTEAVANYVGIRPRLARSDELTKAVTERNSTRFSREVDHALERDHVQRFSVQCFRSILRGSRPE